jgi:hypothetical protein
MPAPSAIPLVVHQVWVQGGREAMPPHVRRMTEWTEQLTRQAGGEYRLWQESDLLPDMERDLPARLADVYRSAPNFAAKSDILRMVVLKLHGGFYMDTDMLLLRPAELAWLAAAHADGSCPQLVLPFLLDADGDRLTWSLPTNNCMMAAPSGSPLVAAILDDIAQAAEVFDAERHSPFMWTLRSTGPTMIARVVLEDPDRVRRTRLLSKDIVRQSGIISSEDVLSDPPEATASGLLEALRERYPTTVALHGQDRSWFLSGHRSLATVIKSAQHFASTNASVILIVAVVMTALAAVAVVGWARAMTRGRRATKASGRRVKRA